MVEPELYDYVYAGEESYAITFDGDGLFFVRNVSEDALEKIVAALNGARFLGIKEGERRAMEACKNDGSK